MGNAAGAGSGQEEAPYNRQSESMDSVASEKTATQNSHTTSPTPSTVHNIETTYEKGADVEAVPSSAIEAPALVVVPRRQRRGLFGRFTIIAEVEEPKHYSRPVKWFITCVVASAAVAAPLGSTIIFPSLDQISQELHASQTIANLSSAFYMLSMAIFPLWWSSFSETLGRRTIYIISFALFVLWNALAAISTSISMLIVFRILGGGAAASVQAVGAGTVADVWESRERGHAMGIFYLGPLMGPLFGPIIGGILGQTLGWRSVQWFLAIYGGVIWIFLFFALPETLKSLKPAIPPSDSIASNRPNLSRTTSRTSAVAANTRNYARLLHRIFIEPLSILLYLRYPAVLITIYYASITFGSLYLLNVSLQATYSKPPYNFSTIAVGLTYIPNSIGYIISSLVGGRWSDRIMAREARRAGRYTPDGKLVYRPEDRMRENAWIAAIMYPGALVWYGWTAAKGVAWPVPLVANFFFGLGSMIIFSVATTMLTEFMPRRASAGVAANNFVRNIFSFAGAVVAQPLIDAIGNGWLFTIVGVWAGASCVVVWAMTRFGPRWRERMIRELG